MDKVFSLLDFGTQNPTAGHNLHQSPAPCSQSGRTAIGATLGANHRHGGRQQLQDIADTTKLVGLRDAALLATLQSSGLRVSELVSLQVGNITTTKGKGGRVAYLLTGVMGKGQVTGRDAGLSVEAYNRIMTWVNARPVVSQYLFTQINTGTAGNVQEPTGTPISEVAAWKLVVKYAKRAGLEHVKPHDFRRFVGTQLAKTDIRQAQKALGHKRISTTMDNYVLDDLEAGLTDDLC